MLCGLARLAWLRATAKSAREDVLGEARLGVLIQSRTRICGGISSESARDLYVVSTPQTRIRSGMGTASALDVAGDVGARQDKCHDGDERPAAEGSS